MSIKENIGTLTRTKLIKKEKNIMLYIRMKLMPEEEKKES